MQILLPSPSFRSKSRPDQSLCSERQHSTNSQYLQMDGWVSVGYETVERKLTLVCFLGAGGSEIENDVI